MGSRLLYPSRRLWVANGVEEPAKQGEAISAPEPKASRVGRKRVRERPRIVVDGANGVGDDLRHRFGVFLVVEEVGGDARRPCDGHPVEDDPLARGNGSLMQPDVLTARLPPNREGELVPIRGEVPEAVQRCGGAVGDDPLIWGSLPCRNLRGELQPGCPELEVIRWRRPREPIHPLCHPVKDARCCETLQGGLRDAGALGLTASDKAPLILSDLCEATERGVSWHHCNIPQY